MNALSHIQAPMSAIEHTALALALPEDLAFNDWLAQGRSLATQKHAIDWNCAKWVAFGLKKFPEQLSLALDEIGIDEKRAKRLAKAVETFGLSQITPKLTVDHYAHVADLGDDALPLLKKAEQEKLAPGELRQLAMEFKMDVGRIDIRDEDDAYDRQMTEMVICHNKSMQSVRDDFKELAEQHNWGFIEL